MENDKETKDKLIESAKIEFLEKGFMKASLRSICKNAGVTTGALYFFFKDKNDLFSTIVSEPMAKLLSIIQEHFSDDEAIMSNPNWINISLSEHQEGHDNFQQLIVKYLYENYDEFILLLTKSQGTDYENILDSLVDLMGKSYKKMYESARLDNPEMVVSDYMIHWLSHISIDAYAHLIIYEKNVENAINNIDKIMHIVLQCWLELLHEKI